MNHSCHIVYGVPVTEKLYREIFDSKECPMMDFGVFAEEEEYVEIEDTQTVGWYGVSMAEFDEFNNLQLSKVATMRPTEKQIAEMKEKIAALPEEARNKLPTPDVYVAWGIY